MSFPQALSIRATAFNFGISNLPTFFSLYTTESSYSLFCLENRRSCQDTVGISRINAYQSSDYFLFFYHKIFCVTFDESFASATGTDAGLYNLLIAVIIAVIIVLAMNLVGSLLISALVIFPALSAMRVFRSFRSVTICSAVLSVACALMGILASILAATPVGATVVAADILAFAVFSVIGKISPARA